MSCLFFNHPSFHYGLFTQLNGYSLKSELIDEIKNEMIAFLNTEGGTIFVGVNDDGSLNQNFVEQNQDNTLFKLFCNIYYKEVFSVLHVS